MIDLGKIGEYAFATELLKRGYVPLWPSTETVPYDLAFWNGTRLIRVQIKASKQHPYINLNVNTAERGHKTAYSKMHADIMAIWAVEADRWYLIPIQMTTSSMRFAPESMRCKWRKYIDAWNLLA